MAGTVRQRGSLLRLVLAFVMAIGVAVVAQLPSSAETVAAPIPTAKFVPVGPLRLTDTRQADCGCTRRDASTIEIDIRGSAALADDAVAVAITVTATPTTSDGYVTAYPARTPRPKVSTLNTRTDRTVANSAIIPVGAGGKIALYQLVPGALIVDVTGVFTPAESSRAGRFVSVNARRLVDTREPGPSAGALGARGDLTVALPDGVAADATAIVVNVTTLGEPGPSHLSARPAGGRARSTSFLNSSGFGQAVASATIVPVDPDGFTIRSLRGGHVVVDFLGWFTGPSAAESHIGLFVPVPPRRLIDTRDQLTRLHPKGTIEVPTPVTDAASLVTNVTIVRPDRAGFVTASPAGRARPDTSTVNPAFHDHTLANLAITRVSTRGTAYWSLGGADLIVDLTGYFTGGQAPAVRPPAGNQPSRARVLVVGDSTLAGIDLYAESKAALIGFDAIVDAASCRRLLRPSCLSDRTGLVPNTAYEAILTTPGTLDIVVVKAGYNDWFSDFPVEFGAVVHAARVKGAHTILWMTYNEDVRRPTARRAYQENNTDLRWLAAQPQYSDVLLADWLAYSTSRQDWFGDGTHVGRNGAWALSDYISRSIASVEHRPCPRPWVPSGPVPSPCPRPELVGPVPDPPGLY